MPYREMKEVPIEEEAPVTSTPEQPIFGSQVKLTRLKRVFDEKANGAQLAHFGYGYPGRFSPYDFYIALIECVEAQQMEINKLHAEISDLKTMSCYKARLGK